MGKFGIGARVRDLDNHDGTIVEKAKGERLVKLDGSDEHRWLSKSDLRVVAVLRLVEGGYYTSRSGKTFGPLIPSVDVERNNEWPWTVAGGNPIDDSWTDTGHVYASHVVDDNDLVAEVVLPAEPAMPQFEVGQRVVMVRERDGGFARTVVAKIIGDDGQVYLPLQIEFEAEVDFGQTWYVDPSDIAPFTLEAGKFYRTRDGRKVGPMVPGHYAAEWPLTVEHYFDTKTYGKAWRLDGTFDPYRRSNAADIVEEWVEPAAAAETIFVVEDATDPALVVVAGKRYRGKSGAEYDVVDNSDNEFWPLKTADGERFWKVDGSAWSGRGILTQCPAGDDLVSLVEPQPKFKVGDRVRVVSANSDHQERYVGTEFVIDKDEGLLNDEQCWSGSDHNSPYRFKSSQLSLVPHLYIGKAVTAAGYISGANGDNFSVVFANSNRSYDLPATALRAA